MANTEIKNDISTEEQSNQITEPQVQPHSKNFYKVKNFYEKKLWNKVRVYNVVSRWITEDEYEEITGETYELK